MFGALRQTQHTYDRLGQVLSEAGPWASDTVKYTYVNGLRTNRGLQMAGGARTSGYAHEPPITIVPGYMSTPINFPG